MTILFVDDDKDTRDLFHIVFTLVGHQVKVARDGHEALSLLERTAVPFYVAVLDYYMPDMNGLEIIRRFKLSIIKSRTCFVLFTRASRGELDQEAKALGVSRLIHKPALPASVIGVVEQVANNAAQ